VGRRYLSPHFVMTKTSPPRTSVRLSKKPGDDIDCFTCLPISIRTVSRESGSKRLEPVVRAPPVDNPPSYAPVRKFGMPGDDIVCCAGILVSIQTLDRDEPCKAHWSLCERVEGKDAQLPSLSSSSSRRDPDAATHLSLLFSHLWSAGDRARAATAPPKNSEKP
jgi:hypothetical protein